MDIDPSLSDAQLSALDLESLDVESLFSALTAVEKAIPVLLGCIKPILADLQSGSSSDAGEEGQARQAVARYMDLLDKIQFVLRQTVYYLHETKASPNTLRPPPPGSIPTPFASTLPTSSSSEVSASKVELGLYGRRIEAKTLGEMVEVLQRLREGLGTVPPERHATLDQSTPIAPG